MKSCIFKNTFIYTRLYNYPRSLQVIESQDIDVWCAIKRMGNHLNSILISWKQLKLCYTELIDFKIYSIMHFLWRWHFVCPKYQDYAKVCDESLKKRIFSLSKNFISQTRWYYWNFFLFVLKRHLLDILN
jgi:hypothetical protein